MLFFGIWPFVLAEHVEETNSFFIHANINENVTYRPIFDFLSFLDINPSTENTRRIYYHPTKGPLFTGLSKNIMFWWTFCKSRVSDVFHLTEASYPLNVMKELFSKIHVEMLFK